MRYLIAFAVMTGVARADLPIVAETYDSAIIVTDQPAHNWVRSQVYFVRGEKIIAARTYRDMNWNLVDGKFILQWVDYGTCERNITVNTVIDISGEQPEKSFDDGAWWRMNKRMTDLKAPE